MQAYLVFAILMLTILLFIWGKWRYDTVAIFSLLLMVMLRLIPASEAFIGFSNPAVITVACVMIITTVISESGLVEQVAKRIELISKKPVLHVGSLCFLTAILSAFMNNVGALALMMPIAISSSINAGRSPSLILMPLSFASVLGGLCTSIGTPPNLLVSSFREEITGHAFMMFDFTPIGSMIALVGVLFISIIGWRLIPARQKITGNTEDQFPINDYISEIKVPEDSKVIGKNCYQLECLIEGDFSILGLVRKREKKLSIKPNEVLQANDILIIEASHDDLHNLLEAGQLKIAGDELITTERLKGDDASLMEAVVTPGSRIEGRSWSRMRIRSRLSVNLLAISRSGRAFKNRLNRVNLNAGDVLLLQGPTETLRENIINLGLVPLAERAIKLGFKNNMLWPVVIFLGAILLAAAKVTTIAISFLLAISGMVALGILPMRMVYRHIDWSIVTLLAAMIPIGGALQSSGATKLISDTILVIAGTHSPLLLIAILLFVTMTLSDVMNNAATAVVMAPIAASLAHSLHMPVDAFLMAVAIGASCSFLTPISHQNNTLVMGPGAYKFFDYLRLGIPIEIIVLLIAIPGIYYFWL